MLQFLGGIDANVFPIRGCGVYDPFPGALSFSLGRRQHEDQIIPAITLASSQIQRLLVLANRAQGKKEHARVGTQARANKRDTCSS